MFLGCLHRPPQGRRSPQNSPRLTAPSMVSGEMRAQNRDLLEVCRVIGRLRGAIGVKHGRSWTKAQGTRVLHQHLEEHLYFTSLTGTKEATQGHTPSYSHRGHRLSNLGTHTCISARAPQWADTPTPNAHTYMDFHPHARSSAHTATHLHKPPGNHIHMHNLTCMQSATRPITCVHAKSSHTHTHQLAKVSSNTRIHFPPSRLLRSSLSPTRADNPPGLRLCR